MEARNAAGRRVSLLNDDSSAYRQPQYSQHTAPRSAAYPTVSPRGGSPSPSTPELWRSDSYDSQMSNTDVVSPLTPSGDYGYPRTSSGHLHKVTDGSITKRPVRLDSSRTSSHEDDSATHGSERPAKRYPCRFRDSHGCDKTFTTSGHASRHSKIHTAEKAVQCTFAGCQKKFTRADNMKQHLETHYKDKSRSAAHRGHKSSPAEARRNSTSSRSRSSTMSDYPQELEVRQYALPTPPQPSPNGSASRSAWEVRGVNLPLHSRPTPPHAPKSGLDALAMAVACQEGN